MIDRRRFLEITAGTGASLALGPQLLRALPPFQQSRGQLIQRAIPSTGEKLPVIGLGFANHTSCADPAALKEVLKTFFDNGGRFFDTNHGNAPNAQKVPPELANELGIQDQLFWSVRAIVGSGGGPRPTLEASKAHFESLFTTFRKPKLDMVMGYPDADPAYWAVMKEAKKAGRVRYLAAMVPSFAPYPRVEAILQNEPLDFIGVDYCIDRRDAEEKILPLAQERKIAVMAFFPFGGANGYSCAGGRGVFARVANTPLPAWAAEFDAKTWAQFFLKYVSSHPAITVTRVGTTKAAHMLDNIGGGIGRMPNEAMRKRMAEFIEDIPLPVEPQILERYVGQYAAPSGLAATFRRDGATLFVKLGDKPEVPVVGRSWSRFSDRQGSIFQFELAGVGPATRAVGVIVEQGGQKILLERK